MRKIVKGTIGTYIEFLPGKTETHISPLKVLNAYIKCEGVPLKWGTARLAELSSAIQWALNEIPDEVIQTQEDLENADESCFEEQEA